MPPSQLKRLKASLREQGITGPQQSKKEKKSNKATGRNNDRRVQRNVALESIREQFNPFEVKATTKGKKFGTANDSIVGKSKDPVARPGVTRGLGEETRRKTLLLEMQRRNKVGGINDRRFGENDPFMTPEEKMMERFTREQQSRHKRGSMFDLEDDDDGGEGQLTHFGKSLSFDDAPMDDFEEGDLGVSDESDGEEKRGRKRRRPSEADGDEEVSGEEGEPEPERKKSKAEVMKEVIAKSKLHKYERQKTKEDDDELRDELDQGLPALIALMHGHPAKPAAPPAPATQDPNMHINPERAALMNGAAKPAVDKEYDERLRQMAFDKRSKPTERTKTDEEKVEEEAKRLRDLEEKRQRRMRGEEESEDEAPTRDEEELEDDADDLQNDAADFGFDSAPLPTYSSRRPPVDVEDEDDFLIDDDLVASGSDLDLDAVEEGSDESGSEEEDQDDGEREDDDEEFIGGLLSKDEKDMPEFGFKLPSSTGAATSSNGELAFTFPCPQTHEELLEATKTVALVDLPTAVQRIRALHNPKLAADNKAKLGVFSTVLVEHIVYLANQPSHPPFSVLETLVRHVHSLARTYPDEVGRAFRQQLKSFQETRPNAPTAGDLIVLTAVGCIFPTSDHFHQVVTPASLSMARYLGQKFPQTLHDLATGAYLATLCLQYQRLSKRYYPEFMNFVLNALYVLAPTKPESSNLPANIPYHEPTMSLRLQKAPSAEPKPMHFYDTQPPSAPLKKDAAESLKSTLIATFISLLDTAADLWTGTSAFFEIFEPALQTTQFLQSKASRAKLPQDSVLSKTIRKTHAKLQRVLQHARLARRPLELHHHKPRPIKSVIPKFEETFNPDKHYDPDRERAEASKLRAEHKRERKGALRELRKDASFIARENLRQKKEADRAYEQKYKRLVAEIQGEEGREKNAYEREKRMRKGRS
ncbi:nucleolar complex protein 14 [Xylona heveae TC161]|uniref:Nucleolar complex protein 14 n=1 Tax=Xylona heveae (strain CBS 132557 / TC161) TaxID=1328760 RepID=A0A165JB24_XYLHT|nr:nucleolar complex protein 14 [Xylona heveae TC161]KZF25995.1 nucleolar complex protein 14 [Xylona heveae TC161]